MQIGSRVGEAWNSTAISIENSDITNYSHLGTLSLGVGMASDREIWRRLASFIQHYCENPVTKSKHEREMVSPCTVYNV